MAPKTIYEAPRVAPAPGETVVTSTCGHNCGGRCVVNAHVRDGKIVKISTDPRKWTPEMPPLHACVRDTYGPAAILDASRSGNTAMLHNRASLQRLLYMFGGCTELWTNISAEAEVFAVRETFGQKAEYKSAGREPIDYVNSKL